MHSARVHRECCVLQETADATPTYVVHLPGEPGANQEPAETEPVVTEPVAAEPVAAEPVAAEATAEGGVHIVLHG